MARYDAIDYASKIAAKGGRRDPTRSPFRHRETLATMMLGGSSMAIGLLTLVATIAGLNGSPMNDSQKPRRIQVYAGTAWQRVVDGETGKSYEARLPVYKPGAQVYVPSNDMLWLPVSGWLLGLAGLIVGAWSRQWSWWSLIGFSASLATMLLVLAFLINLEP